MVPQTTQATASNNKGFTLVELIVVITILAILGTIGFLSLQGYSGQSRDSKRTSDLRTLSTSVTTKSTEGISLISMVGGTGSRVTSASYAGANAVAGTDYEAGVPNYTVLGLNSSNFKDPLGSEYRVGASTKNNGVFQVAAKMEPSGSSTNGIASVTGNYVARLNPPTYTASGTSGSTSITNINSQSVGLIRKGDVIYVNGPNTTYTVSSVSGDGLSLLLTTALSANVTTGIRLGSSGGTSETAGLIASTTATIPVVDQSGSTLPY